MSEREKVVVVMVREMEPEIAEAAKALAMAIRNWRWIEAKVDKILATAAPGAPEERLAVAVHGVCNRLAEAVCTVPDPFWGMMLAHDDTGSAQIPAGKEEEEIVMGAECAPVF